MRSHGKCQAVTKARRVARIYAMFDGVSAVFRLPAK